MAFYVFREKVYDQKIERVEKKGNSLFLYEGYYEDDRVILPFPHHLLPNEPDKQAALTFLTCSDAIGYLHELFRTMLKGQSVSQSVSQGHVSASSPPRLSLSHKQTSQALVPVSSKQTSKCKRRNDY